VEIKSPRKSPRFQQIVWLDAEVFKWIVELSTEKGVAPNQVISQLLYALYEGQKTGKLQPVLTVERKVEVYRCIFCEYKTTRFNEVLDHMIAKHRDKLRELG